MIKKLRQVMDLHVAESDVCGGQWGIYHSSIVSGAGSSASQCNFRYSRNPVQNMVI